METITLNVKGMNCGHCVRAVKNAIEDTTGASEVEVSLERGTAVYTADPSTIEPVKKAIAEEGFSVED
ncbi:cation transporter [Kamptonema cortianum]|nr:cation transporter [Geitlerinema splendidum]MDK3158600.1 cation transporter [Kamptonema cortianum]